MSTEVDAYFLKKSPNFLKKGKDVNKSGGHHHKWCISTDYA